jgi:hypothetical protein
MEDLIARQREQFAKAKAQSLARMHRRLSEPDAPTELQ